MYFPLFWRLGSLRTRHRILAFCWGSSSWFIAGTFSLYPQRMEGTRKLSGISFRRGYFHSWGLHLHYLITAQSLHLLIPSHQALGFQHMNFGGYKHSYHSTIYTYRYRHQDDGNMCELSLCVWNLESRGCFMHCQIHWKAEVKGIGSR